MVGGDQLRAELSGRGAAERVVSVALAGGALIDPGDPAVLVPHPASSADSVAAAVTSAERRLISLTPASPRFRYLGDAVPRRGVAARHARHPAGLNSQFTDGAHHCGDLPTHSFASVTAWWNGCRLPAGSADRLDSLRRPPKPPCARSRCRQGSSGSTALPAVAPAWQCQARRDHPAAEQGRITGRANHDQVPGSAARCSVCGRWRRPVSGYSR